MKKIVWTCGLFAGLISSSLFIALMLLGKAQMTHFKHGMIYGYTLMLLAFSLIFVATRIVRDKQNGGVISFGQAFKIGFYITLIASTVYVGVWLIDYYAFNPDFAEKYSAQMLDQMKASGASEQEIAKETARMASFAQMYKNPLFVILLTYVEILPPGLLISLISAWILRRKTAGTVSVAV